MADTAAIIEQARKLGDAIAAHPRVRTFLDIQRRIRDDQQARKLLEDYQRQAQHIQQRLAERKPVEVEDKRRLGELEQQMASNETLKQFMRAQVDYLDLMNQVNQAMEQAIAGGGATGS